MKNVFLGIAAIAAVVAIGGVVYFGTGANQQASVANITSKSKVVPQPTPTFPTEGNGDITPQVKAQLESVVSTLKSINVTPAGTASKYKVVKLGEGYCAVLQGHTVKYIFEC